MGDTYKIYIDESCHLEHDNFPIMCIGYIKIEQNKYEELKLALKSMKLKHKSPSELKWQTMSLSRKALYIDLIDFFFAHPIEFRCVLIKDKHKLDHRRFNKGDHDSFYYKTVYLLLNSHTNPATEQYKVLLDIKDTRGREKLRHIEEVFRSKYRGNSPFLSFQHIRSHENELMQLTDFFIGAVGYKARGIHKAENASLVKQVVVQYLETKSGYQLDEGTEPWESKFNIFDFQPKSS